MTFYLPYSDVLSRHTVMCSPGFGLRDNDYHPPQHELHYRGCFHSLPTKKSQGNGQGLEVRHWNMCSRTICSATQYVQLLAISVCHFYFQTLGAESLTSLDALC